VDREVQDIEAAPLLHCLIEHKKNSALLNWRGSRFAEEYGSMTFFSPVLEKGWDHEYRQVYNYMDLEYFPAIVHLF
jgi:hypothetical protein